MSPEPAQGLLPLQEQRPGHHEKQGDGKFAENGHRQVHPEAEAAAIAKGEAEKSVLPRVVEYDKKLCHEFDV